ncbi:MAG: ABC transporter permease [Candidimonas sp.]|nr:MAG: ABC transporter permease [Candidimonas sp.]
MRTQRNQPIPKWQLITLNVVSLIGFFVLWQVAATLHFAPAQFLPSPIAVLEKLIELTRNPFAGYTLQQDILSSLGRFALGFILAALIGVPLGLAMGWFPWVDDMVSTPFNAVRFVAPIAWVPFAALWFGVGIGGPVLIIFTGAFPACLINSYRGAKYVPTQFIEAARMLGVSNFRVITDVLLPGSIPSIIAGLRVSAGLGWMSLVGAELIVASSGVGYLLVKGQSNIDTAIVMSGMISIGIVGLIIDVLLRLVERRVRVKRGQ